MSHEDHLPDLAGDLRKLAEGVEAPADLRAGVERKIRRLRRRHRARQLAGAAAVVLAVAGIASTGTLLRYHHRPTPDATSTRPTGTLLDWPARGTAASDGALINGATRTWRAARGPRTDVRTLYAGDTAVGTIVVLQGRDRAGGARLAWLTTPADGGAVRGGSLVVRVDRALPARSPLATSFVTSRVGADTGGTDHVFGYALAAPGYRVQLASRLVDQEITDMADAGKELAVSVLPRGASAFTTDVVVSGSGGGPVSRLPADGGADADPAPVRVRLAAAGAGRARFAVGGARRIAAGMAVATPDGLVGTVSAVGGDTGGVTGTVTLVSSPAARIPVRTVGAESAAVLTGGADRLAGTVPLAEAGARVLTGGSCASWVTVGTVASPSGVVPVTTVLPATAWILPDCKLTGG
ncbi:MAG: hypothetical protein ACJ73S_24435 [Mycobacteriales bacterium]